MGSIISPVTPGIDISTPENASPKKKAFRLLPANDASRQDWGIISDSLKLPAHAQPTPGSTPKEAAGQMKALLEKVVGRDEDFDALIMKCSGDRIAGALQGAPAFSRDMLLPYLRNRLWNRNSKGNKTVSKKGLEHSTNDIIQAWDPEKGGIHAYIQSNVGRILRRDWLKECQTQLPGHVSQQVLEAKNIVVASDFTVQNRSMPPSGGSSDEEPDVMESERDIAGDRLSSDLKPNDANDPGEGEDEVEDEFEGNPTIDAKGKRGDTENEMTREPITEERQFFDVAVEVSGYVSNDSPTLSTPEHPDYRTLSAALAEKVPEPASDLEARNEQLRGMVKRAVERHYDGQEDKDEVLDAVPEWNPAETTFARFFPEVCERIGDLLNRHTPKNVIPTGFQAEFALDYASMVDELDRVSRGQTAHPPNMTPLEWDEVRSDAEAWFTTPCHNPDELGNAMRPDYLGLCALTRTPVNADLSGEELASELKDLYNQWAESTFRTRKQFGKSTNKFTENYDVLTEMNDRMQSWNPLTDGFAGEVMVIVLKEISEERKAQESKRVDDLAQGDIDAQARRAAAMPKINIRPVPIPQGIQGTLSFDETDFLNTPDSAPRPLLQTPHIPEFSQSDPHH